MELPSATGTARSASQGILQMGSVITRLFAHDWLHALSSEIDFYTVACNTFELRNAFVL
jgi:hypothetical protein